MAYFCLSHNHSDFHQLMALVISKTLGYTAVGEMTVAEGYESGTGDIVKRDLMPNTTWPYNEYTITMGVTTQSEFNASADRAALLQSFLDDHINHKVNHICKATYPAIGTCVCVPVGDPNRRYCCAEERYQPHDETGTNDGRPEYNHTDCLWHAHADGSDCVYGDIHWGGGVDDSLTIDTTTYDNIVAITDSKVIHCTWNDWTHSSWTTDFKDRCKAFDSNLSDDRFTNYELNMRAITYPSNSDNFVLYQDKILDKDEAHYTALCTFLGATELSASVWKGYVDAYKTYISS